MQHGCLAKPLYWRFLFVLPAEILKCLCNLLDSNSQTLEPDLDVEGIEMVSIISIGVYFFFILAAYIISPSHGKLKLSIMHCGLGFKYHSFSRLVVSSTEFGEVRVKFRPSHLPWWRSMLYPTFYTPFALAVAGILP